MEWTGARYADKPTVEVRTWIDAPPARVWEVVSDIELMPAMSSELQSVEWLDGADRQGVGARFLGRSRHEALGEWEATSYVVEFEPERVFGWAVGDSASPSARWRFRLEPKDGGTGLSEWVQLGPARSGLSFAIDQMPDKEQKIVFVRMREFERNMAATLEHIKTLAEFSAAWQAWHAGQQARLADPHGFLAITSIHWLTETPERFDDAPGAWRTGPDGVTVELAGDEELVIDSAAVRGRHSFGVIPERGGVNAIWGDAVIEVAKRGGYDIVRPRHPDTPLRLQFAGTPAYPPHPRWSVTGRYVPFDEPRPTTVGAAVDGLQHVYDAPGRIEFELDGQPLSLTAFPGHGPGSLMVLFTDATSGVTTYAANRVLRVAAPGPDGLVALDFNRAANLPCAYTDLATCPLPPPENRLPVAIEAGEKIPAGRR